MTISSFGERERGPAPSTFIPILPIFLSMDTNIITTKYLDQGSYRMRLIVYALIHTQGFILYFWPDSFKLQVTDIHEKLIQFTKATPLCPMCVLTVSSMSFACLAMKVLKISMGRPHGVSHSIPYASQTAKLRLQNKTDTTMGHRCFLIAKDFIKGAFSLQRVGLEILPNKLVIDGVFLTNEIQITIRWAFFQTCSSHKCPTVS